MSQRSARLGDGPVGELGRWCFRHRRMTLLTWALGVTCLICLEADFGAGIIPAPSSAGAIASVLGLGVGVDWALLVVSRFRAAVRIAPGRPLLGLAPRPGQSPEAAVVTAMRAAGGPVLTAGGTIVAGLLGLLLPGGPDLDRVAVAVTAAVAVLVAATLTLLPALLACTGTRLVPPRPGRPRPGRAGAGLLARRPVAQRWASAVRRRPALAALAAVTGLVALAAPAERLRLIFPDPAAPARGRGPVGYATAATWPRPGAAAHAVAAGLLGGRLPWLIAAVAGLGMLLLLAAFRPAAIAITTAAMNLLSVAAAGGALALVSQGEWTRQALGFPARLPVTPWMPAFLFVILFGLSTDYQILLLARVREACGAAATGPGRAGRGSGAPGGPGTAGGPVGMGERVGAGGPVGVGERAGREVVSRGLAGSARAIAAAGTIMIAAFLVGVPGAGVPVRPVVLGLAMAIVIDVTLVRLVLAPAVLEILGEANWWRPGPLDRLLPATSRFGDEPPATRDRQPTVAD